MNTDDIQKYYDNGNTELVATMADGSKQALRLFVSTSGSLAYFGKGKRRHGYAIYGIARDIESVIVKDNKKSEQTEQEKYFENLKKFKKTFTQNLHLNLWSDLRKAYNEFDIEDFENFVNKSEVEKESSYNFYKLLVEYCQLKHSNVITENKHKITTIKSNSPKGYGSSYEYNMCVANIKKHLDKKENFNYAWRSTYDVSVSGKLCEDGVYRAWFSLEFRGCGNGHYYLLVNENQAVFYEND